MENSTASTGQSAHADDSPQLADPRGIGVGGGSSARENLLKAVGVAAWQPPPSINNGSGNPAPLLPRARLGPLPSRRPYTTAGALKQPRGLASCVIREDMPYPPANAEVTFEIRTTTVRHGRKLLRYSASSPLDTIYIKIPNASPTGLHQPLLQSLCHTIDLGHQRIVVGGSVRPGCALIALDLMGNMGLDLNLGREFDLGEDYDLGRDLDDANAEVAAEADGADRREKAGDGGGRGGRRESASPPPWLNALATVLSSGGGVGGGDDAAGDHSKRLAAAAAVVGKGLSQALRGLGVDLPEEGEGGLTLALQFRGSVLEARFRGEAQGGWELRVVQREGTPAARAAAAADAAGAGGGISISLAQQVLVAPTAVGEAVKVSVRARGLPDLTVEEEAGGSTGDGRVGGRYSFAVRGLGRYLPVLGVPAPTTPTLDSAGSFDSSGEGAINSVGYDSGGGRRRVERSSAFVAAVAAAAVAAASNGGGEATEDDDDDADAMGAVMGVGGGGVAVAGGNAARGPASPVPQDRPRRLLAPYSISSPSTSPACSGIATSVPFPIHRRGAAAASAAMAATAAAAAEAPPACLYELTVAGLGVGRGGSAAAATGPVLLQLELWQSTRRLLACKPLLLLPPPLAGLAAELQALVRQQQELQQREEEEGAAAAGVGAQHGGGGASSADQLLSDVGMWMEFVHDSLQATAVEPRAGGAAAAAPGGILLPGSLDLRGEVLAHRRRQPAFAAAALRTGLGLLAAVVSYGCGPLVEHVMADFRALGYSATELWAAAGTGDADTAADEEGDSMLHLAAAAGDLVTLRAVAGLAEAAAAASGGGSCWWLRGGGGRTPLHLLAAAAAAATADGGAAAVALEWVLSREGGGEAALWAWRKARDMYGLTPAEVLAEAEAAARSGAAPRPGEGRLSARMEELIRSAAPALSFSAYPAGPGPAEVVGQAAEQLRPSPDPQPLAAAGGGGDLAACGPADLQQRQPQQEGQAASPVVAAASPVVAAAATSHDWRTRCRRRAAGTAALLRASLAGFDAVAVTPGSSSSIDSANPSAAPKTVGSADATGTAYTEAQYQSYVSRRTLGLAQGWVVLHLLLAVSAVRRLLADGRPLEVPAALLYSAGHMVMAGVMRAVPGFRLYLPHRGAWWAAVSLLRTSGKVAQLAGLVVLPEATLLRYVRGGVTLVSDCVLPALFEPCPLPCALAFLLYDFFVTAVLYLRIGYAADPATALCRAAFKSGLALGLRLGVDATHRGAFLRSLRLADAVPQSKAVAGPTPCAPARAQSAAARARPVGKGKGKGD